MGDGAKRQTTFGVDIGPSDYREVGKDGKSEDGKNAAGNASNKSQLLDVQAKEGLTLGLAITVRYRLDAKRLDYIQSNLPRPVEKEIVPPIVASVWRELVPNYTVRDVFSAKREEVRQKAAGMITQKLAAADIAFARVNTPAELTRHPHLRRITIGTPSGPVSYPAPAEQKSATKHYGPVPAIGEHTDKIRAEFMPAVVAGAQ